MKRILIINLAGIGDFLLSTPSLRALRNKYNEAEIYLLITPRIYKIAKNLNYINKIVAFNLNYGGKMSFLSTLRNFLILIKLRKKHFDLAINMRTINTDESARKMKLFFEVINPKLKAGRDTEGRGDFFDIKIPETTIGKKYEMEYDIDTVKALGVDVIDRSIDFIIDSASEKKVEEILNQQGVLENDILIGIYPGGMSSRRWPLEYYAQAIDKIYSKFQAKFVIGVGRDEMHLASKLTNMANANIINLAGLLDIIELGALIRRCNLFITNDTGPMHIAAILKTPLIAVRGSTDFVRFDPRNISDKVIVLYKKVDCAPCEKVECEDLKCLKIISPAEVIEGALKLLGVENLR